MKSIEDLTVEEWCADPRGRALFALQKVLSGAIALNILSEREAFALKMTFIQQFETITESEIKQTAKDLTQIMREGLAK